jgi:hypothetical protein
VPSQAADPVAGGTVDPIRMSVINAVIELAGYNATYPGSSTAEAQRVLSQGLAASTGHAYAEAAALIGDLPSFSVPIGTDRRGTIRILLRELTISRRPAWASLIPKGRRFVAAYLPPNAYQCLDAAGLYAEVPDAAALEWWDELSSQFRSVTDLDRTRVGREGERLTMAYEEERLAGAGRPDLKPKWVALEDNSLGYDVLSYSVDVNGTESPLHIEVKSTASGARRMFLTRNEWKVATSLADTFALYFWDLESQSLTVVGVDYLQVNVPTDQGRGRWDTVQIGI